MYFYCFQVSNVTANGCKLRWKPPLDDGGMPILVNLHFHKLQMRTYRSKNKQLENKF
jgi:hypothetical protein